MTSDATQRVAAFVGFAVGGAAGAAAFWAVGYYSWVAPIRHPLTNLMAFVTVMVFPMSLVAPLALVRYLGRNLEGARRWGVTLAGYALLIGFTFALASLGVFQALGIDTASEALAFFAAVFGATFGGIAGSKLAARVAAPGVRTDDGSSPGWEKDGTDYDWGDDASDEGSGWDG